MPEVHLIGEIVGGSDFEHGRLFLKYEFQCGSDKWTLLDGVASGQTQLCACDKYSLEDGIVSWNQPVDAYYTTTTLTGWPKLLVQVWHEDEVGRSELSGYGLVQLPTCPGEHKIEMVAWRPQGTLTQKMYNFFLGTASHLEHKQLVGSSADRFDLFTETAGLVHLRLEVLTRGFRNRGVVFTGCPEMDS